MGFLDKLLGRAPQQQAPGAGGGSWSTPAAQQGQGSAQPFGQSAPQSGSPSAGGEDERAVARYRYLLRTAPPETLEQVHAEAFAKLTPEQRQEVLTGLSQSAPEGEAPRSAEPQDLARAATRAEVREPGTLERTFGRGSVGGGGGTGMGMGGMVMGSMMGTIGGVIVGSAIANVLFADYGSSPEAAEAGESGADAGSDSGSSDAGSDSGSSDSGDSGGSADSGDSGGGDMGSSGDFGGGSDFGGGDFGGGGGDFGGGGGDFGGGF